MQRFSGLVFGPGFQKAGAKVEFDLSNYGLRVITPEAIDGEPPWSRVSLRQQGFNGTQLMLQWQGSAGDYALAVSDLAAQQAITAFARQAAPASLQSAQRADATTRAWSHGLIWLTFVLPLLALVLFLVFSRQVAGWAADRMSVETEMQLGEKLWSMQKQQLRIIDTPTQAQAAISEIGARLTKGSRYKYTFTLVDDPAINAFAMPGGYVVVHSGLIRRAESAEELAGVLAHEVQHVEKRHGLKNMAHSLGMAAVVSLVLGDVSGIAAGAVEHLATSRFSRESETEADLGGMKMLDAAGINPVGMQSFFKKMSDDTKIALPAILSSHPASEDRFALIAANLPKGKTYTPLAYDWAALKTELVGKLPPAKSSLPPKSAPDAVPNPKAGNAETQSKKPN
jgi:beta-barrel assembly-enhancing protease